MPGLQFKGSISLRPARPSDEQFLAELYAGTREDLRMLAAERGVVESLTEWQRQCQSKGYAETFPNAMHFVVEAQGARIGRLILDIGSSEVRVVDLSFIPAARGKGYGRDVLVGLQQASKTTGATLCLTVASDNIMARQLYLGLGFTVRARQSGFEFLCWNPWGAVETTN